jgi:pimeloyl-ACP methyl ester carboxylesterase
MPVAQHGRVWLQWEAEGHGEPVLMIMGLSGSLRAWYRLRPHVAAGHRAILLDNRGTGDSDGVTGPLSMRDMAGDALAVLDAAGEESAHVIGVSMGGMVAQHLALDHRERVRSLILGCTTAGGGGISRPPWRLLATAALRPLAGPARTFPLLAPALYAERSRREHPDRVDADLEIRIADATDARTTYAQMAAVARHDTRARLGELTGLPVTVLHGTEDVLMPIERGRELAGLIPGARLVEIPGAAHMLSTDAEDATAAAILAHLKRCAERSSQAA